MDLDQDVLHIYTDGSCYPNPGPGGWGAVLIWRDQIKTVYGGVSDQTNNSMELTAILEALRLRKDDSKKTVIYSDSKYSINAVTVWCKKWAERGWITSSGGEVKNSHIIKEILPLRKNVEFKWVRGHAGDPLNEAADILAGKGRALEGGGDNKDPDPDGTKVKTLIEQATGAVPSREEKVKTKEHNNLVHSLAALWVFTRDEIPENETEIVEEGYIKARKFLHLAKKIGEL